MYLLRDIDAFVRIEAQSLNGDIEGVRYHTGYHIG